MKDLNVMLTVVKEGHIADPFDEHEADLIALDTREIMDPEIQRCLCTIEELERTLRGEAVRERVDLATKETYKNDSIKTQTQRMRDETASRRTRVSANDPIPKGKEYQKFLSDTNNKDGLFQFLAEELTIKMRSSSCMFITIKREFVLSNKDIDTNSLSPCDHEEGDTKIFLHLKHAVIEGNKKAFIRTVDNDIVVIAISVFHRL